MWLGIAGSLNKQIISSAELASHAMANVLGLKTPSQSQFAYSCVCVCVTAHARKRIDTAPSLDVHLLVIDYSLLSTGHLVSQFEPITFTHTPNRY